MSYKEKNEQFEDKKIRLISILQQLKTGDGPKIQRKQQIPFKIAIQ